MDFLIRCQTMGGASMRSDKEGGLLYPSQSNPLSAPHTSTHPIEILSTEICPYDNIKI